jgi:uncharacterized protein YciI
MERNPMPKQYLYRIQPVREGFLIGSTPEEDAIISEHFDYLKALTEQGVVLMAGRTVNTEDTSHGLVIFLAASEIAARAVMENDPAVRAGVFRAELFPFAVALASSGILPH